MESYQLLLHTCLELWQIWQALCQKDGSSRTVTEWSGRLQFCRKLPMEKGHMHSERRHLRHLPLQSSLLLAIVSDDTFEFLSLQLILLATTESGLKTSSCCKARSPSNVVMWNISFLVSVGKRNLHELANWKIHDGNSPMVTILKSLIHKKKQVTEDFK